MTVTEHERNLRQLRCAVSMMTPVTLHHCHGGSMLNVGWHVGMGQRQNPYLQIPLHERYHTGRFGIDAGVGVQTWEGQLGTQVALLDETEDLLGYNIWDLARAYENQSDQGND